MPADRTPRPTDAEVSAAVKVQRRAAGCGGSFPSPAQTSRANRVMAAFEAHGTAERPR